MTQLRTIFRGTNRTRARNAGFTLIELLVAMTLLGLIFVALFGGLRLGTRAWEAGTQRAESLSQVGIAQAFLRLQIRQAWMPDRRGYVQQGGGLFVGSADALRFVVPSPPQFQIVGRSELRLEVVDGDRHRNLTLTWYPYRPAEPASADRVDSRSVVLVDAVESVALSYYGRLAPGDEPDWHERWTSNSDLPRLVRLRVVFEAGDARYWPELLVAPKAAGALPR